MKLFKKKDIRTPPRLKLDWSAGNTSAAVDQVFDHAMNLAEDAIGWYISAKNTKRFFARGLRVLAILLGAAAALLPTVGELFARDGESLVRAGWTAVLLGLVGVALLLDRFYGFSTGWMRYIATELQLQQITHEFQIDWEAERAGWEGSPPNREQAVQMIARAKAFIVQINGIIRVETAQWIQEFESTLRQLDEAARVKPAINEPGGLNLTVANGNTTTNGWTLTIDGGTPELHRGTAAAKRSLVPGYHEVRIKGEIGGRAVQAERIVKVPAGGTCEEVLTLS